MKKYIIGLMLVSISLIVNGNTIIAANNSNKVKLTKPRIIITADP